MAETLNNRTRPEQDAEYWLKISLQREQEGDIGGAIQATDRAIGIRPGQLNYWKVKEKQSLKAGKKREAIFYHIIFDAMIPQELKYLALESIPELFGQGLLAYSRNDKAGAAGYFRRVMYHGNLPAFVWTILSGLFDDMGMANEAAKCNAAARDPADGDGHLLLSETIPIQEQKTLSMTTDGPGIGGASPEWYDPWFENNPDLVRNPATLFKKGYLMLLKKYPEEAGPYFDRVYSLDCADPAVWGQLHAGYIKIGNAEKAASCHRRALNLILQEYSGNMPLPEDAPPAEYAARETEAIKNLVLSSDAKKVAFVATTLFQMGRYTDALPLLIRIAALDSGVHRQMELCDCYVHLGELDRASEILRNVLSKYPDNLLALAEQAKFLNAIGDYAEAFTAAEKAIQYNPEKSSPFFGNACHQKSYALWKLGRDEKALAVVDSWLSSNKDVAEEIRAVTLKGNILYSLGKYEDACTCFDRVIALLPDQEYAYRRKGECLEKAGNPGEARVWFEKALSNRRQIREEKSRYTIAKKIGMGGFGTVFLGYDHFMSRVVALKTYRDEFASNRNVIQQFRKEAEIWVRMGSHRNIVQAQDVEIIDNRLYVVIDYIAPGKNGSNTLGGRLKSADPGLSQVIQWAIQLCHGMEHGYSSGIICHRDIKPANIMIGPDNIARITDFGLADAFRSAVMSPDESCLLDDQNIGSSCVSCNGKCAGTPTHMPPEQFTDAGTCDVQSDIYSFGIVLYQMISRGFLPYPVENLLRKPISKEQMFAEFYRIHTNIRQYIPCHNSPLIPVILRCLQPEKALRYPSFSALREDLEKVPASLSEKNPEPAPAVTRERTDDEELFQKAKSLMVLRLYNEAVILYDRIIAKYPGNLTAWINRGVCYYNMGNFEESLRCAVRAMEISPSEPSAWENKAECLFLLKKFPDCRDCCNQIIVKFPDNWKGYYFKARAMAAEKGNETALPIINDALQIFPESEDLWILKGILIQPPLENYHGKGRFAIHTRDRAMDAMQCFEKVIWLNPTNSLALLNKAMVLSALGSNDESIAFFNRVLQADPGQIYAWQGKAISLAELGHISEAIACCDECLKRNGSNVKIQQLKDIFTKGMTNQGSGPILPDNYGNNPSSVSPQRFQTAATEEIATVIQKGRNLVIAGKKREAVKWFDDLIKKYPKSDELWVEKGIAIIGAVHVGSLTAYNPDEVHEALRCYENASILNPRCINALIMQGLLYYEMLDFTEAHDSIDRALEIDPHSIAALKVKAMTYAESARFEEAIECCDRCLKLNSTHVDIQQLREKYAAGLKKHGKRQPLPGINFKEQFPESKKIPQQIPIQKPVAQYNTADLDIFNRRFSQCVGGTGNGTLAVNMECIIALVKEDPDRARQFVTWRCSESSVTLKTLQMVWFIGIALQMHCGDSWTLDMIRKRALDFQGK